MAEGAGLEDAAAAAAQELEHLINSGHIAELNRLQIQILGRLQDSNAVLGHFNDFSSRSYAAVAADFTQNTRLLRSMKADMESIFRRIQSLKALLSKHHPEAYASAVESCEDKRPNLEEAPSH